MKRTSFVCVGSLLFALVTSFGYLWTYQHLDLMRSEVFLRERAASEQKLQESRGGGVRQLFASTMLERATLEQYFVHQEEVAGIVSRLEKLGAESGVVAEVSGIGIEGGSPSKLESGVRSVDITLQGVGTRAAAEDFLRRLELFPQVLSVKEVSLERLMNFETRGERWRLAASLRIGVIHQ